MSSGGRGIQYVGQCRDMARKFGRAKKSALKLAVRAAEGRRSVMDLIAKELISNFKHPILCFNSTIRRSLWQHRVPNAKLWHFNLFVCSANVCWKGIVIFQEYRDNC